MRVVCTYVTILFAATLVPLVPASACPGASLNDVYAQATPADQSAAKKQKAKHKRAPKVEYMRAVPSK